MAVSVTLVRILNVDTSMRLLREFQNRVQRHGVHQPHNDLPGKLGVPARICVASVPTLSVATSRTPTA